MSAVALTADEREALAAIAHDRRLAREKAEAEASQRQAEADRVAALRSELESLTDADRAFYADEAAEDLQAMSTAFDAWVAAYERLEARCVRHVETVTHPLVGIRRQLEPARLGQDIAAPHPLERLEPSIREASTRDKSTHGRKRVFEATLTEQHFRRY